MKATLCRVSSDPSPATTGTLIQGLGRANVRAFFFSDSVSVEGHVRQYEAEMHTRASPRPTTTGVDMGRNPKIMRQP